MVAEDEEVQRVGREKRGGRTEGCAAAQRDMKTETKTEVRAAKEGSEAVVREEVERSKRTRIRATYRTCTISLSLSLLSLSLSPLSLHARGFTDYAPVDRARSSARLRAAGTRAKATPERYERVVRERRGRTRGQVRADSNGIVGRLRQSDGAVGAHRPIRWRRGHYAFIIRRQKEMTVYK